MKQVYYKNANKKGADFFYFLGRKLARVSGMNPQLINVTTAIDINSFDVILNFTYFY